MKEILEKQNDELMKVLKLGFDKNMDRHSNVI